MCQEAQSESNAKLVTMKNRKGEKQQAEKWCEPDVGEFDEVMIVCQI